ncbi:MAG: hypothetical protein JKY45_02135 [Emcibacter sp.]|nr:hypothetical protein [Emcibacter sp.]
MKYYLIPLLVIGLSACDFIPLKTPQQQACKEIAVNRLKHKGSYDMISISEKINKGGQIEVYLNFDAWNDFKVPLPHSIYCVFQEAENAPLSLLSIKWNGRLIRRHELDDIREYLKQEN